MKTNKYIVMSITKNFFRVQVALVFLAMSFVLSISSTTHAQPSSGETPYRCYNNASEVVSCPPTSVFSNYEIGKCYRVVPENQGQTSVVEIPCPNASTEPDGDDTTNGGSDDSNSERPGSVSNNCTRLTEDQKANLSSGDPCYALKTTDNVGDFQCGRGPEDDPEGGKAIKTSINIGCRGVDYPGDSEVNPIIDLLFALFRVLSAGVGLVIIGSIIVAGIQYSASRGNPQTTQASITRVTNAVIALLLYIFMYALANFLVPGGILL